MALRTILYTWALETVFEEIVYTRTRLEVHPQTKHLAGPFVVMRDEFFALDKEDYLLIEQRQVGIALCQAADDVLDPLVDQVAGKALLAANQNRQSPVFLQFFKNLRPSDIKRPVLNEGLEAVRPWPASLAASEFEDLRELAKPLEATIVQADEAMVKRADADQKIVDFRTVGGRRKFIDSINALRGETHGQLIKIRHEHPELTSDFADQFFRHQSRSKKQTSVELEEEILSLKAQLEERERTLKMLQEQEQAVLRAQQDADQAATKAELKAAEEEAEEALKRVAELKAKVK